MEQRQLGDTDLFSSSIGFGTWEMSTTMYGHIDVKEASDAVNAAIDHGITLFDTAEVYGPYHSEELLAKALGDKRKDIVLVSKVGFQYDENGQIPGRNSQYDHVIERAEGCLSRLETDFAEQFPFRRTPPQLAVSAKQRHLKQRGAQVIFTNLTSTDFSLKPFKKLPKIFKIFKN